MLLLVSFAGQEDEESMDAAIHPCRVYAIVTSRHLPGAFQVLKVQAVPYQSVSQSLPSCFMTAHVQVDVELWRPDAPKTPNRGAGEVGCNSVR